MVMRIEVHLQSEDVSIYWLWLLLYVSALSVVIVIIVIYDMPRQEFSLCERVYIHNTYMKSRKLYSETQCKFRVKFQDDLCLIPAQLGDRLKDSMKQAP